jgi:2-polyprenyl-6-methoxyphenol hydroxylase-like FAD-dependent oxidoreductase
MTTLSQPSTSVLIVGAGPTGLMMACQLQRFGISFRIIEKNAGPTTQSRALAIQARSLELFAQMGIAQKATQQGKPAHAVNYVTRGQISQKISLEGHGDGLTAFPYLLILDQSRTEQLLIDTLKTAGRSVEWQTELVSFREDRHGVLAMVKQPDGTEETIQAQWLVGADGARSVVRHQLGIPFEGQTHTSSLFVLDCKVDLPFDENEAYIAFSDTSFAAFFPMTEGRCRVISILPEDLPEDQPVTFEAVAAGFAARMQIDVQLSDPRWISAYRSHHRHVATFRKDHCFLAGDAAHIHSPVGAQGMNTGLQDAYNLAWKLAFVISGQALPDLLDTYNEERIPIARSLVWTTDRVFGLTLSKNPILRFWIMSVAPRMLALILKQPTLARFVFKTISQIGIHYRASRLSSEASQGHFLNQAPQPGDRLPFVKFQDSGQRVNIQDKVKQAAFHLFLFPGPQVTSQAKMLENGLRSFNDSIVVETILLTPDTAILYETLGIQHGGCYLVRPDLYIAYRSATLNVEHLERYLTRFLIPAPLKEAVLS